jgi:hypothetical protein
MELKLARKPVVRGEKPPPNSTLSTINPTLTLLGENNISCHKARNIVKKGIYELYRTKSFASRS